MGTALRTVASAVASASGTATFNFASPTIGEVWTGSVFVSGAPSAAASSVTVGSTSGGLPWGTMVGGQALLVQAVAGEVIQVTSTGLKAGTSYTAVLAGSVDPEQSASYTGPFPAPPAANTGLVAQLVPPIISGFTSVTAGTPAFAFGTAAFLDEIGSSAEQTFAIAGITVLDAGAAAGTRFFQFYAGPDAGGFGAATQIGGWNVYLPAGGSANLTISPTPEFVVPANVSTDLWVVAAGDVAGLVTKIIPVLIQL